MKRLVLILLASAAALCAEDTALDLDPAQTQVQFTLSDILHTVHGDFKLKRGNVHYDLATGKASGEIVIDAQSGNSGSAARDKRMHKNILESDKYPEIIFRPDHVDGALSKANLHGKFWIHGQEHEMNMQVQTVPGSDGLSVNAQFAVPYVLWGMKNPSTLFLRVGDTVSIDVHGKGRVQTESAARQPSGQ